MFTELDSELERQANRLTDSIFDSPTVKTLADIHRLVSSLAPKPPTTTTVAADVSFVDDVGGKHVQKAAADVADISKRDMLVAGMSMVKARIDVSKAIAADDVEPLVVNGRTIRRKVAAISDVPLGWLDKLIERWLGGRREGQFITWVIADGTFKYDVTEHRLFKAGSGHGAGVSPRP